MTDDGERTPTTTDDEGATSLEERTRRLYEHLEATAELPIGRETNRWIGEAEALARDVATNDIDRETTRERVATIRDLLAEAGETGIDEADAHLESARRLCTAVVDEDA